MHAICEIVIPPTDDVRSAIAQIMESFDQEDGDGTWWDFYVIGGRYSGHKIEVGLDRTQLDRFHAVLNERKVTVGGVTCGKQELSPDTQIPMVDTLWQEMFPGKGEKCPLFAHFWDQYGRNGINSQDICTVAEIPKNLFCNRLIIAGPCWDGSDKIEPKRMLVNEIWNGIEHQKTQFDGNVESALVIATKDANWKKCAVGPDWLCVTVDYHN